MKLIQADTEVNSDTKILTGRYRCYAVWYWRLSVWYVFNSW